VEDKIRTLSILMEQADKKIFLMNREFGKVQKEETIVYKRPQFNSNANEKPGDAYQESVNTVLNNPPVEEPDVYTPHSSHPQEAYTQASFDDEQPVRIDFQSNDQRSIQDPPKTSKQRVLEMYTRGEDVNSIASKLNITLGEIELILSMNQRSASER